MWNLLLRKYISTIRHSASLAFLLPVFRGTVRWKKCNHGCGLGKCHSSESESKGCRNLTLPLILLRFPVFIVYDTSAAYDDSFRPYFFFFFGFGFFFFCFFFMLKLSWCRRTWTNITVWRKRRLKAEDWRCIIIGCTIPKEHIEWLVDSKTRPFAIAIAISTAAPSTDWYSCKSGAPLYV